MTCSGTGDVKFNCAVVWNDATNKVFTNFAKVT